MERQGNGAAPAVSGGGGSGLRRLRIPTGASPGGGSGQMLLESPLLLPGLLVRYPIALFPSSRPAAGFFSHVLPLVHCHTSCKALPGTSQRRRGTVRY